MKNTPLQDGVKRIERTQTWYEYRNVRFYIVEQPYPKEVSLAFTEHFDRHHKQWGYICIPAHLSSWELDTPLEEINTALQYQFDHVRREVSHLQDPPYNESWRKPSWYILVGWDYQHSWNYDDESETTIVMHCMDKIDWLYENNIVAEKSI